MEYVNPYHYVTNAISGKWKMTLLHHIHHYGKIRFNETKKTLGVSEKVLSQQLKELTRDGLVERIQYNTIPLKVEYILTPAGEDLIPALDILYIWSVRRLAELDMPIDPDAFKVHTEMKYEDELRDVLRQYFKRHDLPLSDDLKKTLTGEETEEELKEAEEREAAKEQKKKAKQKSAGSKKKS